MVQLSPGWPTRELLGNQRTLFSVEESPCKAKRKGVDIVHTLGLGSGGTALGLLRIPHVFGGSQCLQGRECSSSPTSGKTFSLVRGFFALTCVQSLCGGVSDARGAGFGLAAAEPMQVCGVAGSVSWLVGTPPAGLRLYASSFGLCRVGRVASPFHGPGERERHNRGDSYTGRSGNRPLWQFGNACARLCPAKVSVDSVNTYV